MTAIQKDTVNLVCVVDRVEPLSGGKDETDKAMQAATLHESAYYEGSETGFGVCDTRKHEKS